MKKSNNSIKFSHYENIRKINREIFIRNSEMQKYMKNYFSANLIVM